MSKMGGEREGPVLTVTCKDREGPDKEAQLYLGSLARLMKDTKLRADGRQSIRGACLLHEDKWVSPNQFVSKICGQKSSNPRWKLNIKHNGVTMMKLLEQKTVVLDLENCEKCACYCDRCTGINAVRMRNGPNSSAIKKPRQMTLDNLRLGATRHTPRPNGYRQHADLHSPHPGVHEELNSSAMPEEEEGEWLSVRRGKPKGALPNQYGDAGQDARSHDIDETLMRKQGTKRASDGEDSPTKLRQMLLPELASRLSQKSTERLSVSTEEDCIEISDDEDGISISTGSNRDNEPMEVDPPELMEQHLPQRDTEEVMETREDDSKDKPEASSTMSRRTFVHFGITEGEIKSLEEEDVDIFFEGDLLMPDIVQEEDDMTRYGTLLNDLCGKDYERFQKHLFRESVPTDDNLVFDKTHVRKCITRLHNMHKTSRPPWLAYLNEKDVLVLCVDNRLDGDGSIRCELQEQQKAVTADTVDSQPVEEDNFPVEQEEVERRRRKQPDAEKPAYRDSQRFLAELLVQRNQLISHKLWGKSLQDLYDHFCPVIYTPRAKMLESQTKTRTMSADAECFAPEVYKDPKKLFDAAEKCVQILLTRTRADKATKAEKRHKELMDEAKRSPRTFYLIIADEAHWGPTSEARPDDDTGEDGADNTSAKGKGKKTSSAYSKFVNSWTDDEYPNVFVLLVSATPYNLLTKNTRLDLDTMCVTEVKDGKHQLRLATESDAMKKQSRLHHMKWEELIDYEIQQGLCKKVMIPLANYNRYVYVDENGVIHATKKEENKLTKLHFKGPSSNEVHIKIIRNGEEETLVVCEDLTKKRQDIDVRFLPSDDLCLYESRLYTFNVILHGMDVLHLETSDGRYIIDRKEVGVDDNVNVTVFASEKLAETQIKRKECFFVYEKQPENTLVPGDEYRSLNFYFNSMAEDLEYNAFLRSDSYFDGMADGILKEGKSRSWDMYDILTADYAVHMLHIFEIRECKLVHRDLDVVLSTMHEACGSYTANRDQLILDFEQELQQKSKSGDKRFKWIEPFLFKTVLRHLEDRSMNSLRRSLMRFLLPDGHEDKDKDTDVCSFLVECLLFLRKSSLEKFQGEISQVLASDKRFRDIYNRFSNFDFEEQKMKRVKENETCRLIDDLVLAKDDKPLHGSMKIVRMTTDSGNKMYATLCLARKIASPKAYTFEIVRDFDKWHIKDVGTKPESSEYRIHQVLQCRDCTHSDKGTYERCQCTNQRGDFGVDLKCSKCDHVHTTVRDYIDLKDLPCLVILVGKGRMGDTFPDNFNAMDLRVSTRDQKNPTLTPLVQEFGRMCCYGKKDDIGKIPYILLGMKLADTLVKMRRNNASLFDGFDERHRDAYIEAGNKAKESHADYKNDKKHINRILLEAEPQIGKTGVYLCYASLLRKLIEGEHEEEEEELEEIDEDDMETDICGVNDAADWRRPYWQQIDKRPVLKKTLPTGKYASLFGPYVFGKQPEKIVGTRDTSTKVTKPVSTRQGDSTKFRTLSKLAPHRASATCGKKEYAIKVSGAGSQLSVPTLLRFHPLFDILHLDDELLDLASTQEHTDEHQEELVSWIFTPSHGRCRRAYLNYDQTMIDSHGRPVKYVHVIVVRASEYNSYVREWGFSHAVICLPPSLPEAYNVGAEDGGVGYARLFVQLMAEQYGLPAVFMLDDTLLCVSEVNTRYQDGKEMVEEENGMHSFDNIPLFACLKDMELQLYGENDKPPKDTGTFEPYPSDNVHRDTQESFTGPWAKYGVIGVLRNNKYVHTYKNPFNRTHVTAATLVNIKALSAKNLRYKPWQVWEDLNMNNQCDQAGLWVVKYNKYVIRKVVINNWLPNCFKWKDDTQMSTEPAPTKETNCLLALTKYVSHYCRVKKTQTVASDKTAPCEDVRQLTDKLCQQKQGSHHLVIVDDEETDITEIQVSVGTAFSFNNGKVALVLPTRVCLNHRLTSKNAFQKMLAKCIDGSFCFDCITSEDVSKKPVSLVLVHLQVPQSKAQAAVKGNALKGRQTDPKPNEDSENEVMDMETDEPLVQPSTSNADNQHDVEGPTGQASNTDIQFKQPSTSHIPQRNTKSPIAPQGAGDPGAQGSGPISNQQLNASIDAEIQQESATGNSQDAQRCQNCETLVQGITKNNWMENDSTIRQVLADRKVETWHVLLCDTCVQYINESRLELTKVLRKRRNACEIRRDVSKMSITSKSSVPKKRLSLSGRRDAATSSSSSGNTGAASVAVATPSRMSQTVQSPHSLNSTRRPLQYGSHPQQAEPATPENIDSILQEDLSLSQDTSMFK